MKPSVAPIRLIVGLGNPGEQYRDTRHNAGFWFVDRLAQEAGAGFRAESRFFGELARLNHAASDCWLLKPTTFMNHSGRSVSTLANYYRLAPNQILLAHDDLDLEPGCARLKFAGGHGGHNGLRDTVSALGSKDFARLRLGIGHPGRREQVVNYVLGRPSREDRQAIESGIDAVLPLLPDLLSGQWQRAVNALHSG